MSVNGGCRTANVSCLPPDRRAATRHEAGPCRVSSCLRPCGQVAEGLVLQAALAALLAAVAALLTLQPARAFLPVPPPP